MSLSDKDKTRIFDKLDDLGNSSTRTEVKLEGLHEGMQALKEGLKDHEILGSSQYHGLLNKVNRVTERVSVLESTPKSKPFSMKGVVAAIAALIAAVTGAWASLR